MPSASPSPHWIRLQVSGRDRAKFLHNFCTNDVRGLEAGRACEAFFTDVKARVLGHGFILAFDERHEIWMLIDAASGLLRHLSRYVITEDVQFLELPDTDVCGIASESLTAAVVERITGLSGSYVIASMRTFSLDTDSRSPCGNRVVGLTVDWAGTLLTLFAGDAANLADFRVRLAGQGASLLTVSELERLRIEERFPAAGRDLLPEHLAPEADRNSTAISYRKGCYLGQEPIARLDAMGHVNRALRKIEVDGEISEVAGASLQTASGAVIGSLTSAADAPGGHCLGLAVVRLAAIKELIFAVSASSRRFSARVLPLS